MTANENEQLVVFRLKKAKEALVDATSLTDAGRWNLAVNRYYYACFYAVTALLAQSHIYAKTHSGAKQMFGMHFIKTGQISTKLNDFYVKVFSMRQSGDYEDFCEYNKADVYELVAPAKEFVAVIEELIRGNFVNQQ